MNEIWIATMVTVPVAELICYWVASITLAMIAGLGWAFYATEKGRRRNRNNLFCPFIEENQSTPIIKKPHKEKYD